MGGLKDITAEEFKVKFSQLQLRTYGDPQDATQQRWVKPLPGGNPTPAIKLHELYDLCD